LTDAEWGFLEPYFPAGSKLGRPRKWSDRAIMDSLFYLLRGGLPWRMLPKDFPPVSTVQRYFHAWRDSGFWKTINHLMLMSVRGGGGTPSVSQRRRYRQPKRENDRGRRPARLRRGQENQRP
jgi:transposase